MRYRVAVVLVVALGCGGEMGEDAGGAGEDAGMEDGGGGGDGGLCDGADDGTACGGGRICIAGACLESECGDSYVDVDAGEECDDGNGTAFDGCETDCTFTCHETTECSDGDLCNGAEECSDTTHVCEPGTGFPDGTPCMQADESIGVCREQACVAPGCGNGVVETGEQCDDMNATPDDGCEADCTYSCTTDADCVDATVCNGAETCNTTTHACSAGTLLVCNDASTCTTDTCDAALGCRFTLIDADGDGHAPFSAGSCGDDCDDGNPDRSPSAQELCTPLVDENCDGDPLPATAPRWYLDCDSDGYAANAIVVEGPQCDPPAPSSGCAWTSRAPTGSRTIDCDDDEPTVNPLALESPGDPGDLDEDCDSEISCYVNFDNDAHRTDVVVLSADGDCGDPGEARSTLPSGDCEDTNPARHPSVPEAPGDALDLDENCDGTVTCFPDADMDGYRTSASIDSSDADCRDPGEALASIMAGDCDDTSASASPGASEVPGDAGDVDEDCSGSVSCYANADGDSHRTTMVVDGGADCTSSGEARASVPPGDCADGDPNVHPGTAEIAGDAGDVDENCDAMIACYANADRDSHRTDTVVPSLDADCGDDGEARAALPSGDCRDTNDTVYPGATEIDGDASDLDENCDGTVTCFANADGDPHRSSTVISSSDADCADMGEARASFAGGDCDDSNAAVHPSATEAPGDAMNLDEDCDGTMLCYANQDGDAFRSSTATIGSSDADCLDNGEAYASIAGGDCNDMAASINPGAAEITGDATDQDENCDGTVSCFVNEDGDGYRLTTAASSIDADCTDMGEARASLPTLDCLDTDATVFPGAAEVAGDAMTLDENCDGTRTCFENLDGDGYRTGTIRTTADADCMDANEAYGSLPSGDCNDNVAAINPGATEAPGDAMNVDENCDMAIACYPNVDGDMYRTNAAVTSTDGDCGDMGEAYATVMTLDCNDMNAAVYPGATEVPGDPMNQDENCNGVVTCYANADNDPNRINTVINSSDADCGDSGEALASRPSNDCDDSNPTVYPGAAEVCDGLDNNCMAGADELTCPVSCTGRYFGTHAYMFCTSSRGWSSANTYCGMEAGSRLVRIDSAAENAFIVSTSMSLGLGDRVWIGASDNASEGVWRWADGVQFWMGGAGGAPVGGLYENWDSSNPDSDDWGLLQRSTGGDWYALADGTTNLDFVCEIW